MNTAQNSKPTTKPSNYTIAFFDVLEDKSANFFKKEFADYNVLTSKGNATEATDEFYTADVISVFITSTLDAETLKRFKNLKYIATRSTGFNHIDLEYCKQHNIGVSNVPSYGQNTVAEHGMAILLALMKNLPESIERVKEGRFDRTGLTGRDLMGQTIGVVGTGRIGAYMIRMAKGFGMKVIGFDVYPNEQLARDLGFEYCDLDCLFKKSDIISLHVPYNEKTHHMINRETLMNMKKGVVIINTARGGLIDTDALFDAIQAKQVGAAGIDVLEQEPLLNEEIELLYRDNYGPDIDFKIALENHVLSHLPNVIITPHNAFNTHEAIQRILDTSRDNISTFLGGSMQNSVIRE